MSIVVSSERPEGLFRLSLESRAFFQGAGDVALLVECFAWQTRSLISICSTSLNQLFSVGWGGGWGKEMSRHLRTYIALPGDPGSIPNMWQFTAL